MPERLPDINLLPTYERRGEGAPIVFYLFFFITIPSFILIGVFYFIYKTKLETAETEYDTLQAEEGSLEAALASLARSEEHTSELQSLGHSVCRLLLATT